MEALLFRLRFFSASAGVIITSFFVIWFVLACLQAVNHAPNSSDAVDMSIINSPNTVTRIAATTISALERSADVTAYATISGLNTVSATTARSTASVAHKPFGSFMAMSQSVGNGVESVGSTIGAGIAFTAHLPMAMAKSATISTFSTVGAILRPANHMADADPVPIIDPKSPALVAAKKALPASPSETTDVPATSHHSSLAIWPLHGRITTLFGVPELPYQAIHTGLDISDGQPSGITPIKAFRQGRVLQTFHSGGLGNHVIVDHGNGVTSVYGHLASISVHAGQNVYTSTTLGYEGSTGVSTGPHLHFEIRVNGQATDPHQFISGQPWE